MLQHHGWHTGARKLHGVQLLPMKDSFHLEFHRIWKRFGHLKAARGFQRKEASAHGLSDASPAV